VHLKDNYFYAVTFEPDLRDFRRKISEVFRHIFLELCAKQEADKMNRDKTPFPKKHVYWLLIGTSLISLILACNLPGGQQIAAEQPNSVDAAVQQTLVAQTVAAAQGQQAPAGQDSAQAPPINTNTATPSPIFTDTPTLTPSITFTPTSNVPMVSVSVDTNCRIGPGKIYKRVGALLVGEKTEVIARDPSNQYWYVRNPDKPGEFCWLWGQYATTTGDTGSLPVFTPPPTPTFTPTPTPAFGISVSFNQVESCVGWNIEFKLTNTGEVMWKSVSTIVTDNDAAATVNSQNDKFEEWNGCLAGSSYEDLDPGDTGYTVGGMFNNDPTGHDLDASVKVCTEDGLGGTCITKTLNITP
jgi:hypothetical protein